MTNNEKQFILKSKNSKSNSFKKPNSLKINQCFIWYPTCSYPVIPYTPYTPLRN